jgi:hypothetical protein
MGFAGDGSELLAYFAAPAVGGPQVAEAGVQGPASVVPFRRATTGRTTQLATTGPQAMTAAQQLVEVPLDGSGFVYAIHLDVTCVVAANVLNVAFQEDAPYNVLALVSFYDVTGETHNLDGYSLHLANIYGSWELEPLNALSNDPGVYQLTAGAVAAGGSFRFHKLIPIAINERDLVGLLGNEDRAQRYFMRNDIAASAVVYSTAPTTLGNVTIARSYRSYTVPSPTNTLGHKQETLPPKWGVIHNINRAVSASVPAGGATIQHQLPKIGNTIRNLIFVLRSNGSRQTAEANMPTRLALYIGDVPLFIDTPAALRTRMFEAFGFDAPAGVYVYTFTRDFNSPRAGTELMEDYLWTQKVTQAYWEVTYPAGFGTAANSLTIITDDMKVPANVDLYA